MDLGISIISTLSVRSLGLISSDHRWQRAPEIYRLLEDLELFAQVLPIHGLDGTLGSPEMVRFFEAPWNRALRGDCTVRKHSIKPSTRLRYDTVNLVLERALFPEEGLATQIIRDLVTSHPQAVCVVHRISEAIVLANTGLPVMLEINDRLTEKPHDLGLFSEKYNVKLVFDTFHILEYASLHRIGNVTRCVMEATEILAPYIGAVHVNLNHKVREFLLAPEDSITTFRMQTLYRNRPAIAEVPHILEYFDWPSLASRALARERAQSLKEVVLECNQKIWWVI